MVLDQLVFRIKTLTPIWTRDINQECNTFREVSFLGSLRWWLEVFVRGLGGHACNPVGTPRCEFDPKEKGSVWKKICPVCYVFGTTNWSRRFRIRIDQEFKRIYNGVLKIRGYNSSWHYPSGLIGFDGDNKIMTLYSSYGEDPNSFDVTSIFNVLFGFISEWGMIGGKTAIGYGAVVFENLNKNTIKPTNGDVKRFLDFVHIKNGKNYREGSRLDEMFFVKFRIKKSCIGNIVERIMKHIDNKKYVKNKLVLLDNEQKQISIKDLLELLRRNYNFLPTSALIRGQLRAKLRDKLSNGSLRHYLMGKLGSASAINISHVYSLNENNWEFRIFGWIRKDMGWGINQKSREEIIVFLREVFNSSEFWQNIFGGECVEKSGGEYLVEYPTNNWNFIDFGNIDLEQRLDAFRDMVLRSV